MASRTVLGAGAEPWVFGYGSLMWDPRFEFAERRPGLVRGWHRRFSLKSTQSWGQPGEPGLCAALHPGGACRGIAYRIARDAWPEVAALLDRRERAYRKRRVRVATPAGTIAALTFVFDPAHPRAATGLSLDEQARLVAQGRGPHGTSLAYLTRTIAEMRAIGAAVNRREAALLAAARCLRGCAASSAS